MSVIDRSYVLNHGKKDKKQARSQTFARRTALDRTLERFVISWIWAGEDNKRKEIDNKARRFIEDYLKQYKLGPEIRSMYYHRYDFIKIKYGK